MAISSTLNVALLASIGPDNKVLLQAVYNPTPIYALAPFQIVEAVFQEHGFLAGADLGRLRAPLQEPLPALADLERHMNKFMLASKKLTQAGQGKQPFEYFEAFLETVQAFPVVAGSMSTYYAAQPTVDLRTIDSLFPYLKSQHPYMLRTSGVSPFSGAATTPAVQATKTKKTKKAKRPVWGPNGAKRAPYHPGNFSCGAQGPHGSQWDPQLAMDEIQRLNALLVQSNANVAAAMMADRFSAYSTNTGSSLRTVPSVFYCFCHGYNISHHGSTCKVMAQDPGYTAEMKTATSAATGGNPNVGPPVTHRVFPVIPPSPNPPTPNCSPCALSSLGQGRAKQRQLPNEDNVSAGLSTRAHARTIRGPNCLSRSRVDELSMRAFLPAVSEPVLPAVSEPVSIPVSSAVSVHVVPAPAVPHPAGCSPISKVKPTKETHHMVNTPVPASTTVRWTRPLITTPKHKSIPNHQSIPNHNLQSNLK
jgi:hypothetical protein